MKLQEVLYSQRLEQEHNIGKVGSLNLWDCCFQHLILVGRLRVQSIALPAWCGGQERDFW